MARMVWLLLFAFCTALAQVPAVDVRLLPEKKCDCCAQPGDCGRPDCGLPPAATQPLLQVRATAQVATPRAPAAPRATEATFILPTPRVRHAAIVPAGPAVVGAVSHPLFQRYCSLLI